jgi:hypothetical protein
MATPATTRHDHDAITPGERERHSTNSFRGVLDRLGKAVALRAANDPSELPFLEATRVPPSTILFFP